MNCEDDGVNRAIEEREIGHCHKVELEEEGANGENVEETTRWCEEDRMLLKTEAQDNVGRFVSTEQ